MIYVVDWDIPVEKRRMFYYYLNKVRRKLGIDCLMSTRSVLVTEDEKIAREVHKVAGRFGKSNLYEARKIE